MKKTVLWFTHRVLSRLFLRIFVGVRFDNCSFLQDEKQFIIVANHNSHLDTMTIMASLPRNVIHKVRPVAAADHFGKTKLKANLTNYFMNALLIQRKRDKENAEKDPIFQMIKALDEGFSLIIFPEGTRGAPEVQQPLKPGVGVVLSHRPTVKYVPAFMKGMGKAMPKDDSLIVPHISTLVYGRPTTVNSTDVTSIMGQIERDLHALKERL
jgi:1-acyl-sn-glycerol-3-phosphate acyltransferase